MIEATKRADTFVGMHLMHLSVLKTVYPYLLTFIYYVRMVHGTSTDSRELLLLSMVQVTAVSLKHGLIIAGI